MLAEARRSYREQRITAESVRLIEGDLLTHPFRRGAFDLSSERFESEAHLHCLCVARKAAA